MVVPLLAKACNLCPFNNEYCTALSSIRFNFMAPLFLRGKYNRLMSAIHFKRNYYFPLVQFVKNDGFRYTNFKIIEEKNSYR